MDNAQENRDADMQYIQNLRFYEKTIPVPGDKVVLQFIKLEETLVRVHLLEYEDYPAMIVLSEITRMKKISSLPKLCPINHITVGEVLTTEMKDGNTYIFLSIKNLSKKDQDEYMEFFHKSRRMLNFMKRISVNTKTPLLDICKHVSWPLYKYISSISNESNKHPLDFIDHPDKIKAAIVFKNNEDKGVDADLELDIDNNDNENNDDNNENNDENNENNEN